MHMRILAANKESGQYFLQCTNRDTILVSKFGKTEQSFEYRGRDIGIRICTIQEQESVCTVIASIEDFVSGFKVLGDSIFKFIHSNTMYWIVRNYAQEGEVFERHIHCYGGFNGPMAMKWFCDSLEAFRIEIFKKIIEINIRG